LSEILERWTADAEDADLPPEGAGAASEADGDSLSESEEPLDPDVLAGLRELGDAELLVELVELFVDDAQSRLPTLQDAFEKGDAETVERTAHTLKGSSGNMGALRMAEACENLQEIGRSRDLSGALELIEQLEAEFDRVRKALEAELLKERP
jgi:HPt (histidine-containing phosphotransfer) domain-containing protein